MKFKPNVDLMLGFIMSGNKRILTMFNWWNHAFATPLGSHQWLLGFCNAQLVRKLLSTEFFFLEIARTQYLYWTMELKILLFCDAFCGKCLWKSTWAIFWVFCNRYTFLKSLYLLRAAKDTEINRGTLKGSSIYWDFILFPLYY